MDKYYMLNGLPERKFRAFIYGIDPIPEWFKNKFTNFDVNNITIGKYVIEGISGCPIVVKKEVFEGMFKYIKSNQEVS